MDWTITDEREVPQKLTELCVYAGVEGCSDIHLIPEDATCTVSMRKYGEVSIYGQYKRELHRYVVGRIKALSYLRSDDVYKALDGKLSFPELENIDIRVSLLPTRYGQSIALRFLRKQGIKSLTEIGLLGVDADVLSALLLKPGLILVSGPTGSGKTTTLHACIKNLLERGMRVITIEDPVEYQQPTCVHIDVREDVQFGFDAALSAVLRQDPDVVVIGEIRTSGSALIACQGALTGHTVLATVHADDIVSSILRLKDYGVSDTLVALSLKGVLNQRLIPKRNGESYIQSQVLVYEFLPLYNKVLKSCSVLDIDAVMQASSCVPLAKQKDSLLKSGLLESDLYAYGII